MKKIIRYGFPIFKGLLIGFIFYISVDLLKAFIVGFGFWAIMEIAGRLNDYEKRN